MSILTRDVILAELESGRLKIEPLDPCQIGPASIDLHLGPELRVVTLRQNGPVPVRDEGEPELVTEVVLAVFVQPGVSNHQVLEMSNLSGVRLELHPGTRICQVVLQRTEGEAVYNGRFARQNSP